MATVSSHRSSSGSRPRLRFTASIITALFLLPAQFNVVHASTDTVVGAAGTNGATGADGTPGGAGANGTAGDPATANATRPWT